MASDLDKILDKINYSRQNNYITQDEAQKLRERARNKANKNGDLTNDEKTSINKLLDAALNKKGQTDKKVDSPPLSRIPDDNKRPPTPPPNNRQPEETAGDKKWKEFIQGYDKLEDKDDKKFISDIFGGGRPDKGAFWETLSDTKQNALINAVKNKRISTEERKRLKNLFQESPKGPEEPSPGTPGDNQRAPRPGEDTGDGGGGGGGGGGAGDDQYSDEPAKGSGSDAVKRGGGKKIDIPKPANRADYTLPEDSKDRLGMPNLDKKIQKEVKKLTLQIVKLTKEFIEGGVDFTGIDYIAENEIFGDDGKPYYTLPDYNSAGESESSIIEDRAEDVRTAINELLNKGQSPGKGQKNDEENERYNYSEYIDLFELRYNSVGDPFFRFSIELTGESIDDLTVYLAEDYNEIQ